MPENQGGLARARTALRDWRLSRPFWGGLFTLLSGLEFFFSTQENPLGGLKVSFGQQGFLAWVLPLALVLCGLLGLFNPLQRMFYGIVAAAAAVFGLMGLNLGGFMLGTLLGMIGGGLMASWMPIDSGGDPAAGEPDGNPGAAQEDPVPQADPAGSSDGGFGSGYQTEPVAGTDLPARGPAGEGHAPASGTAVGSPTPPDRAGAGVLRHGGEAMAVLLVVLAVATGTCLLRSGRAEAATCAGPTTTPAASCPADPAASATAVPASTASPTSVPTAAASATSVPTATVPTATVPATSAPAGTPTTPAVSPSAAPSPGTGGTAAGNASSVGNTAGAGVVGGSAPAPAVADAAALPAIYGTATTATPAPAGVLKVAGEWTLTTDTMLMKGMKYDGVFDVPKAGGGTIRALRFSMDSVSHTPFKLVTQDQSGRMTFTAGELSVSGNAQVYCTYLHGNLLGIFPVRYSPSTPPPISLPGVALPVLIGSVSLGLVDVQSQSLTASSFGLATS
ncbi:MAG TPA: DUF6114 domain-containing protein [Kineosporiaceae bacterium]|nr:DUF6114 domain-containing protein [Kineosporiaceae bacterium]